MCTCTRNIQSVVPVRPVSPAPRQVVQPKEHRDLPLAEVDDALAPVDPARQGLVAEAVRRTQDPPEQDTKPSRLVK